MAPKRGGSSGGSSSGGGGGSSACPGAFHDSLSGTPVVYFAEYCLFFLLTLAVLSCLCCLRTRHGKAKKLIGPFYIASLLFNLLGYGLLIIAVTLRECGKIFYEFYSFAIAYTIFFRLSTYLLLVVVVWSVTSVLQNRLGSGQKVFRIVPLVILAIMGGLTCGLIGVTSYNLWLNNPDGGHSFANSLFAAQDKLTQAYYILYLLSVVAAGAISIKMVFSMRARSIPTDGVVGWLVALFGSMFLWVLLTIVDTSSSTLGRYFTPTTYQALAYVENFIQIFSYIAVILLAKAGAFNTPTVVNPGSTVYAQQPLPYGQMPPPQHQYAYTGHPVQQYYYQQPPVYNGTPLPMNGHGQPVQVK